MIIDTQVLSYAYKRGKHAIYGAKISSVVATEFLEMYAPNEPTRFKYYILYRPSHFGLMQREAPSTYKSPAVDSIVFDFNGEYPTLVEYCSRDVSGIINRRDIVAYAAVLRSLEKSDRKKLKQRFAFLCKNISECVPMTPETAAVGVELLNAFTADNNVKGDFRNTVNDLMILATAITSRERLLTEDNVLSRFAAKYQDIAPTNAGDGLISIDFSSEGLTRRASRESKGYLNRGWTIADKIKRRNIPK